MSKKNFLRDEKTTIGKRYAYHKKKCYFVFFILIFSIVSIILPPNGGINVKHYENLMDDSNSVIQMSSSGPPNNHYFKYYKVITIDHNKVVGTGSYIDFPVLISIEDPDLHLDAQPDGDDIAFSINNNWLDHEIEVFNQSYNNTHAQLVAWVRIPSLSIHFEDFFQINLLPWI